MAMLLKTYLKHSIQNFRMYCFCTTLGSIGIPSKYNDDDDDDDVPLEWYVYRNVHQCHREMARAIECVRERDAMENMEGR